MIFSGDKGLSSSFSNIQFAKFNQVKDKRIIYECFINFSKVIHGNPMSGVLKAGNPFGKKFYRGKLFKFY